jgi:hypothetical protein
MSLISKIEQLKTHELQLMDELATLQTRVRPQTIISFNINPYQEELIN